MKQQILDYVNRNDWVSFAELQTRIDGFKAAPDEPAMEIGHGAFANIILWQGLSQAAVDALKELTVEGKLHWRTGSPLSYYCDGAALQLPIAKQAKSYSKPRWLPVFYRPGPMPRSLKGAPLIRRLSPKRSVMPKRIRAGMTSEVEALRNLKALAQVRRIIAGLGGVRIDSGPDGDIKPPPMPDDLKTIYRNIWPQLSPLDRATLQTWKQENDIGGDGDG
jgi:hypothetical protein